MNLEERSYTYYRYYLAVKLHFDPKSNYNFFKSAGKTRSSLASFKARNDSYFFTKAANIIALETYLERLVTAATLNHNFFIRDIFSKDVVSKNFARVGYLENIEMHFRKDLSLILGECLKKSISKEKLFSNNLNLLFNFYIKELIKTETMILLLECIDSIDLDLDDPLTKHSFAFFMKYKPFISRRFPPQEKLKEILNKEFTLLD